MNIIWLYYILFCILIFIDCFTTVYGISKGYQEKNNIVERFIILKPIADFVMLLILFLIIKYLNIAINNINILMKNV